MRVSVGSRLWPFVSLFALVLAAWQAFATLANTPAYNWSLQVEAPDGDRIPRYYPSLHSYPEYLYQIAFDWRYQPLPPPADRAAEEARSGGGIFTRLRRMRDSAVDGFRAQSVSQVAAAQALRSRAIVVESLRVQPGNPSAWILLAQADAALGDHRAAIEAYLTAQKLAPNTATFALMRLGFLKELLEGAGGLDFARSMVPPQVVQADVLAVQAFPNATTAFAHLTDNLFIRQLLEGQPQAR